MKLAQKKKPPKITKEEEMIPISNLNLTQVEYLIQNT